MDKINLLRHLETKSGFRVVKVHSYVDQDGKKMLAGFAVVNEELQQKRLCRWDECGVSQTNGGPAWDVIEVPDRDEKLITDTAVTVLDLYQETNGGAIAFFLPCNIVLNCMNKEVKRVSIDNAIAWIFANCGLVKCRKCSCWGMGEFSDLTNYTCATCELVNPPYHFSSSHNIPPDVQLADKICKEVEVEEYLKDKANAIYKELRNRAEANNTRDAVQEAGKVYEELKSGEDCGAEKRVQESRLALGINDFKVCWPNKNEGDF